MSCSWLEQTVRSLLRDFYHAMVLILCFVIFTIKKVVDQALIVKISNSL